MKKKDKIYDSPEYKQIREHLPEILKEMERDKGLKQYQMPEGWNEDFERIYQAEHRKERIRNRILAGACAAIILGIGAVHVGERLELTSMVQADDIGKTTENEFEDGEYQYSTYGTVMEEENSGETDDIVFQEDDLVKVYNEIRAEVKRPIFEFGSIPDNCIVEEAIYNKTYRNISMRLNVDDTYVIHINQQKQIDDIGNGTVDEGTIDEKDDIGNGTVDEGTIDEKVRINALDTDAIIYKSAQDDSLKCKIVHDNTVLFVGSNLPKEEFIKLIEGLFYK